MGWGPYVGTWASSRPQTYAVGDGRNDVEMIAWAAHGAVMASAPPEVLALADEVLPDVGADGLVQLLRRL